MLGSLVVLVVVLLCGCSHVEDDISDARIVFGKSIEGISIGDDRLRIVELLGEPTDVAEGDGAFEMWSYDAHGMEIYITPATRGAPFLVTLVRVEAPYDGTTRDGVGIGSNQGVVRSQVGQPTESDSGSGTLDIYRVGTGNLYRHGKGNFDRGGDFLYWFGYRNRTLIRITMMRHS